MVKFTPPASIEDAILRRDSLDLEKKRIEAELSNTDKRDSSGRRMDAIAWNKWRNGMVEEKTIIEQEMGQLKVWLGEERKRRGIGKVGGNPRDALYHMVRAADVLLGKLAAGDNELDVDEKELWMKVRAYLDTHAVLY